MEARIRELEAMASRIWAARVRIWNRKHEQMAVYRTVLRAGWATLEDRGGHYRSFLRLRAAHARLADAHAWIVEKLESIKADATIGGGS